MKTAFLHIFAAALLAGCASGTALVTGTQRDAIPPEQVRIYNEPPASFEVIATVQANSDAGLTMQQKQDSALMELKAQAAKVGANGLLIGHVGEESQTHVGGTYVPLATGGGYVMPYSTTSRKAYLSGTAIYVP